MRTNIDMIVNNVLELLCTFINQNRAARFWTIFAWTLLACRLRPYPAGQVTCVTTKQWWALPETSPQHLTEHPSSSHPRQTKSAHPASDSSHISRSKRSSHLWICYVFGLFSFLAVVAAGADLFGVEVVDVTIDGCFWQLFWLTLRAVAAVVRCFCCCRCHCCLCCSLSLVQCPLLCVVIDVVVFVVVVVDLADCFCCRRWCFCDSFAAPKLYQERIICTLTHTTNLLINNMKGSRPTHVYAYIRKWYISIHRCAIKCANLLYIIHDLTNFFLRIGDP